MTARDRSPAMLVGARPIEVVVHEQPHRQPAPDDGELLPSRHASGTAILIEAGAFPVRPLRGRFPAAPPRLRPREALVLAAPRAGELSLRTEDLEA